MKNLLLSLLLVMVCALCISCETGCSSKNKDVTKVAIPDTSKQVKTTKLPTDTSKIYTGTKGGQYVWKVSKKTGKHYKSYLKK